MTPLERRCRRVVRLLPRDERAARGEEVLGVLAAVVVTAAVGMSWRDQPSTSLVT